MTPVLVTGGSGFVGGAVLRHVVAREGEVRALVRSAEGERTVERLGATAVRGDLAEPTTLLAAMAGVELVFHVAGVNQLCPRDPAPMLRANIDGSVEVVRAAARSGVRRVVYTSSAATIGEARGEIGTEDTIFQGPFLSAYERSKRVAERAVLDEADKLGVELVSVNPSSVQGPGRTSGTARLLLLVANGRLPFLVETDLSVVDVEDCARGHVLAAERGTPGERYILNGANLTTHEAVRLLAEAVGSPPGQVRWLDRDGPAVRALGALASIAARFGGEDPPLCSAAVRTLRHGHRYDGVKATAELGLTYTPIQESVERSVAWYRAQGLLRR
jgi:dihydroflavonol-4-reductase